MLSSTLPDNPDDAELAVTKIKKIKTINPQISSSSDTKLSKRSSSSSSSSSESESKDEEKNQNNKSSESKKTSGYKIFGRNMSPMHFLIVYNREILCFLTLFLTTYATFHNKYGTRTPYYPINARPIFDKDSVVEEFYKGQLTPLQTKASTSGISAILFYAPWSTNSLYVKHYFENLAKIFQDEIYFAAVNCWQPGGECRMQHGKVKSWPVLVVYYPKSLAVQYNGPWQLGPLYKFLLNVLRPIHRIHSLKELEEYNSRHSVVVVGFFSKISGKYQSFYQSAAKWLEYDPLQDVKFCVVVGEIIGKFQIGNENEIQIFYRSNKLSKNFTSWSINSIVNSIKTYTKSLSKYWSGYHRQDIDNLENNLRHNPVMLYFVKRDYHNDNNTSDFILNEVIRNFEIKLSLLSSNKVKENNLSDNSEIKNQENNESLNSSDAASFNSDGNIITRKTKLNQTLSYFLLDIFMYYKLAFQLGLTNSNFKLQQSTAVIIDNLKESVYMFPQSIPLTKESLQQFLEDYELNNLKRNLRNKEIRKLTAKEQQQQEKQHYYFKDDIISPLSKNQINIPEINGDKFHDLIKNYQTNNSTTIILITSTTCSLCSMLKLNILRISNILQNLPIQFYGLDGNNNDLIWEYTMGRYPTLLIIPKHNINNELIDNIRILPYDVEPNEKNILGFIMANLGIPERLYGLLKYCEFLKISNGFFNCLKKTREIIDSIINEQLKLWRNFVTKRKCIEKNLMVLRELYFKVLNSKSSSDIRNALLILNSIQINSNLKQFDKLKHIDIKFACDNDEVLVKTNLLNS